MTAPKQPGKTGWSAVERFGFPPGALTAMNIWLVDWDMHSRKMAALELARALRLEFYSKEISPATTGAEIFGYINANGDYVPSQAYKAYKHGGVFMFEYVHIADHVVLAYINTLFSGNTDRFPCGSIVKRHPDFRLIVSAASTPASGAAAMMDKYVAIEPPRKTKTRRKK